MFLRCLAVFLFVLSVGVCAAPSAKADIDNLLAKQSGKPLFKLSQQTDGAYEMHNPIQALTAEISPTGVNLSSLENGNLASFGLSLQAWGRSSAMNTATYQNLYEKEGAVYLAHQGVIEKFTNSSNGIRQDFIIPEKPAGEGSLQIELSLANATARPFEDGLMLTLNDSGRELAYHRLLVTDSLGKSIPASLQYNTGTQQITIAVHDAQAVYPLMVDPTIVDADWVSLGGIPGSNYSVRAVVAQGSNIYIAGDFTVAGTVLANRVARWDGSTWNALSTGINGTVYALAIDTGGNLYAGGRFTSAGGVTVNNIAKWNGTAWSKLANGANGDVYALATDTLGNLYVGGAFTSVNGGAVNRIAVWNGSAWFSIGTGMDGAVYALAIAGGSIFAGGTFTTAGGVPANRIAEWDGAWNALGAGMNAAVTSLDYGGGYLYAGGQFTTADAVSANHVARWNGTSWAALASGIGDPVSAITLDSSNSDLYAVSASNHSVYHWNGSLWSTLHVGTASNSIYAIAVNNLDHVIVGGLFTEIGNKAAKNIAVWNGSTWSGRGSGVNAAIYAAVIDSTGKLYIGGEFLQAGSTAVNYVASWNGTTWSALAGGTNAAVYALAVDSSDNLYAGGVFDKADGITVRRVTMWNGANWSAMDSGMNNPVYALAVDGSDNLYAGGSFTNAGGTPANRIALWNGSNWSALAGGLSGTVKSLAIDGTDVYAGGSFSKANSVLQVSNIARWNGAAWNAMSTGVNGIVNALTVDSSGNVYAGGTFTTAGGIAAQRIARWNGAGWNALGGGLSSTVNALGVDSSDNLYALGIFSFSGSTAMKAVAIWDGATWSATGQGLNGPGYAIAIDGLNAYVGGDFSLAGGSVAGSIAFLSTDADDDGVTNSLDDFITNAAAALDTDGDGMPDDWLPAFGCVGTTCNSLTLDDDDDNDTVLDVSDNCPVTANLDQVDTDTDGEGNACDPDDDDSDNDNAVDASDNCPAVANTAQTDTDTDGDGDACDSDDDNDGLTDAEEITLGTDPLDSDSDNDGIEDGSDSAPMDNSQLIDGGSNFTGDRFGSSIAVADMNIDGYDDIVVGIPGADVTLISGVVLKDAGAIAVISGKDGTTLDYFEGSVAKQQFGYSVVVIPDQNIDSVPDIAVGDPFADITVGLAVLKDAGSVSIYSGANGALLSPVKNGDVAGDRLGASLAYGDLGFGNDLVIGIPGRDVVDPVTLKAMKDTGRVMVLTGLSGIVRYTRDGSQAGEQFGFAVAVNSVDQQLLVGAPYYDSILPVKLSSNGRVLVFDGSDGISASLLEVTGSSKGNWLGWSLACFNADLDDADAGIDWAAGLSGAAVLNTSTGKLMKAAGSVQLYSGLNSAPTKTLNGAVASDAFGSALGASGDTNNDATNDLVIGVPKYDLSKSQKDSGKLGVYSGAELF